MGELPTFQAWGSVVEDIQYLTSQKQVLESTDSSRSLTIATSSQLRSYEVNVPCYANLMLSSKSSLQHHPVLGCWQPGARRILRQAERLGSVSCRRHGKCEIEKRRNCATDLMLYS